MVRLAEQSSTRYITTMAMDKLINTMNQAHDPLWADKIDSTDIITKWSMDEHENKKVVRQNKLHSDTTRNLYQFRMA